MSCINFVPNGWEFSYNSSQSISAKQGTWQNKNKDKTKTVKVKSNDGNGQIAISGNNFYIREEADIDKVAALLFKKIQGAQINMA